MRRKASSIALSAGISLLVLTAFARTQTRPSAGAFESKVRPILETRCQPCHFPGGKVYDRLPFDREDVVRRLGTSRLFTRLKDEKDRAVLREFLGK